MDHKASLLEQLRIDRAPAASVGIGSRISARVGVVIAILLMLAATAGVAAWVHSRSDVVAVRAAVARSLPTRGLGDSSGASLLDASGYVVALRDATVSAKNIYKVTQILVQQGESVKEGQVIARLDDSNVHAALQQARAQVAQAQAALAAAKFAAEDAQPSFLRKQKELAEGLISPDAFDAIKTSFDAAQAAVAVAERNVALTNAAVLVNQRFEDDTVIKAPFDGVVTAKNAQPGQIVSPQFLGGGGLAEIVDMGSLEVDVDVSENFISRIHPHQSATITLNAYPDWRIPAEVIAIIPTADKSKATVQARVGFKERDPRILPQMGARVAFLAPTPFPKAADSTDASAVVVVPSQAIQGSGNTGTVFVIEEQKLERRTVELSARSADEAQILSGLKPGTTVAVGDLSKLADGERVRVTP